MPERPNIAIFGWLNDDGTVEHRRDRILDQTRKVIQEWPNSTAFLDKFPDIGDSAIPKK